MSITAGNVGVPQPGIGKCKVPVVPRSALRGFDSKCFPTPKFWHISNCFRISSTSSYNSVDSRACDARGDGGGGRGGGGGNNSNHKSTGSEEWDARGGWWVRMGAFGGAAALFQLGLGVPAAHAARGIYKSKKSGLLERVKDALDDDAVQTVLVSAAVGFAAARLVKTLQIAALFLLGAYLMVQFQARKKDPLEELKRELHTIVDSLLNNDRAVNSRDLELLWKDVKGFIRKEGPATVSGFCVGFVLGLA
eukprot:jgi/Botrbrau1/7397/Bobra.0316s0038.1